MAALLDYTVFFAAVLVFGLILLTVAYELCKAVVVVSRRILQGTKRRLPILTEWVRKRTRLPRILQRPARIYWAYVLTILAAGPVLLAVVNTLPSTALHPFLEPISMWARFVGMAVWTAFVLWGMAWGAWDGLEAALPRRDGPKVHRVS